MGVKVTFLREAAADGRAGRAAGDARAEERRSRTENGTSYVFVVQQDTVERRAVQTGGTDGDRLEVTAGLTAGDRVVVAPPAELADGTPIVIK